MKISLTFMAVLADVSMKSRLLSSAYVWASCKHHRDSKHLSDILFHSFTTMFAILICIFVSSHLNINSSLVGDVCLVSCQCYHNVGAGLPLQLFHPVFCSYKCVLAEQKRNQFIMDSMDTCLSTSIPFVLNPQMSCRSSFIYILCYIFNNFTKGRSTTFPTRTIEKKRKRKTVCTDYETVFFFIPKTYCVGNVVDNNSCLCSSVVHWSQAVVTFLTRRVPDFKLDSGVVQTDSLSEKGSYRGKNIFLIR